MQVAVALDSAPALYSHFAANLLKLGPFAPGTHFAVALSGGADSLALTLLMQQWVQAQGGSITALTVDHRLRPDSTIEAQAVQAQMQTLGIAHVILTPEHDANSSNRSEAARQWRYDALSAWCHAHDVLHCLIAHHAGDARETVALHTARGKTADGASGMSAVRNYQHVRFLRPLLTVEKEMLEAYLRHLGQPWVEDPTNQNPAFARARIRQHLVQSPNTQQQLTELAAHASAERVARDQALAKAAVACVTLYPHGAAVLDYSQWAALEPQLASQLLADVLTTISGAIHRPRGEDTRRLAHALHTSRTRRTLHGCTLHWKKDTIHITRETARIAPPILLHGQGTQRWDQRFQLTYALAASTSLTFPLFDEKHRKGGLDATRPAPYMVSTPLPAQVTIGFAPAKPLAAAPFWWFN